MKKFFLLLLVFGFIITACSETKNISIKEFQTALEKAEAAKKINDYNEALRQNDKALDIVTTHPPTIFNIARLHSLLGNKKEAFQYLTKSLELGYGLEAVNDTAFAHFKNSGEFYTIQSLIETMKKPISNSTIAFTYNEKDLVPESIAYDPIEKAYYLGSIYKYKIVKIDSNGTATDFVAERQDSLRMVLGIKVDAPRRLLWVCNSVGRRPAPGISNNEIGWTALFKYDLNTGSLINKYPLYEKGTMHQFNDLAINRMGDVYTTDNFEGSVYRVLSEMDALELFCGSEDLVSANGVTFSADEETLYVSGWTTVLYYIDIQTRELSVLRHPDTFTTYGVDGLYYFDNSLIAVQDGVMRISRFYLNENGTEIEKLEVLEANNPVLDVPTTGVIVDDELLYIANCPLMHFRANGTLAAEELNDVTILKIKL